MKSVLVLNENGYFQDSRVKRECQALLRAGWKVEVITIPEEKSPLGGKEENIRLHFIRLPSGAGTRGFLPKLLRFRGANQEYLRIAGFLSFDFIHANDLDSLPAAVKLKRRAGAKLVYDSHELFPEQFPRTNSLKGKLFRFLFRTCFTFLEKRLIKHADAVITVNESIASELARRYRIPKPLTVMNCPSLQERPSEYRKGENPFLRTFPQIEGRRIILYNGGITEGRGLENLVEAMSSIEEAALIFMGKGPLENSLKKRVEDLGMKERVFFHPPVPPQDVVAFSQWADIGVLPYPDNCLNNHFSLPNKIFEYLLAGLPVASSDLPELRKVVKGNGFGILFNPEKPGDIARAIREILEPKNLEEAKKRVLENAPLLYNWEKEEEKLLRVYQGLLRNEDCFNLG